MSQKELQRCRVLRAVLDGRLTLRKASELMGVSYRHVAREAIKRMLEELMVWEVRVVW